MAIDWDKVTKGIADDAVFAVDGQEVKGSDLKAYLADRNAQIASRPDPKTFEDIRAENAALKKQNQDMAAIFNAAAQQTGNEDPQPVGGRGVAGGLSAADPDEFDQEFGQDPVFGKFSRKFEERLLKNLDGKLFSPWVDKELKPAFKKLADHNTMLQNMLFESRQKDDFRDAGEWPDGMTFEQAREEARKRNLFVPNGQSVGYVDMRRTREELMRPVEQERFVKKAKDEAMEEAVRSLRMSGNVIEMPNRGMGQAPKVVKAKGRTPDEIFGNVVSEAAGDTETQRMLTGMMTGNR